MEELVPIKRVRLGNVKPGETCFQDSRFESGPSPQDLITVAVAEDTPHRQRRVYCDLRGGRMTGSNVSMRTPVWVVKHPDEVQ
jgi:hypothetical protein